MAYLLKNAALILEDGSIDTERDVYIDHGRIERILPSSKTGPEPTGFSASDIDAGTCEVIDCSRFFVSPSLTNLHAHTAMNIFKGIAEDVTADEWFNDRIFPYESKMTPRDVYLGTKLGIAEMLNNGVTAVADHYFCEDQVLKAARETGIRMDLAPTLFGMSPDIRERMREVRAFIEGTPADERIAFHIGPHANYTCPPDVLGEMADLAKALHLPVHTHIAEEEVQVRLSLEQYGLTPFAYMDRAGIFDCPVLFAHGLWITQEDLKYLKPDTMFAFCPKTYMKLGSGRGGFFDLFEELSYSFGTDGAASSNTVDPLEQARLFALLVKFMSRDGRLMPARGLWKQLMHGHAAFPFGTGHMKEGAPADLVIWDLNTPQTSTFYDPVTAILYSANSENVRFTMAAGEFLKYDGKLVMDLDGLLTEIREAQEALLERGQGTAKVTYLRQ